MFYVQALMREGASPHDAVRTVLNMRSIGFALCRSWVYLMFLNTASTVVFASESTWMAYVNVVSTITLTLTLFILAAFGKAATTQRQCWRKFSLAAAATGGGTVCIIAASFIGAHSLVIGVVGGVLTGAGSGVIDMGYGEMYSRLNSRKTNFEVPFAFFLAAVFFCITMQIPPVAASIACSLIPVASALILIRQIMPTLAGEVVPFAEARIDIIPFTWRIGACSCLVGIGDGIVRAICLATPGVSTHEFFVLPLVAGSIATMAIIYLCCIITPPEQGGGLRKVYRSSVFVMAVFYLLLPLIQGFDFLESTMALTGYGTFNVLIWLLLAEIAHRHKLAPHVIFGIGWGMVTIGVLIGALAGNLLVSYQPPMSVVSLVATLCILTSYLFVLKESDFANIVTPADLVAFEEQDIADPNSDAAGPEATVLEVSEPAQDAPIDADEGEGASDEPRKRRFMEGCDIVAEEFGLTPREKELMILYAKGRTSANIQQELFLSRGTVTTHLRHIYQKMDIHSKSELIDAIELRRVVQ